jgi:hypothetical protein
MMYCILVALKWGVFEFIISDIATRIWVCRTDFSDILCKLSVCNLQNQQTIELITNQFNLSPITISELYKTFGK